MHKSDEQMIRSRDLRAVLDIDHQQTKNSRFVTYGDA
jgi:hypothetical protein